MEVRADVTLPEMGNFRRLTVGPPGQGDGRARLHVLRSDDAPERVDCPVHAF